MLESASSEISFNRCWDAVEDLLLQPLQDCIEEIRVMMKAEEGSEREKRDADWLAFAFYVVWFEYLRFVR